MAEESKEQNTPLTLQSFWKILDSKLVSLGIPGALIGVALDFARKSEWKNAGFCMVGAAGVWLIIKVGSKLAPRLDKFLDWIFDNTGIWAKNFWGKITSDFEIKYYERLIYDCREYETEGINQEAFALQNLFVPLKIAQRKADSISNNIIPASVNPLEEQKIGELLVRMSRKDIKQRLVVLGAPGSGKSTLLRYITLMYATRRQRKLHPKVPKLIPVLLQLRKVYEIILKEPQQSLVDLIEKAVENLQSIEPLKPHSGWFLKQLRDGKCLVMLDGLDEIPDDSQRLLVSEWVTKQIDGYNNTPFILTSRPEGYRKAPLQGNVLELEVQPFTHEQRNQFIQDWYLCRKKASNGGKIDLGVRNNAKQKGDKLITQINVSSSLKVMARNPLLLNMIVITYENNGSLSTRRGDLYKEICEVLLERRRREKGLPILLSAEQKLTVLKSLALKLVQENTQAFTLEESSTRDNIFKQAKLLIQEKLDRFPQQGITSEDFIKKDDWGVRELLSQKKQEGIYEFAHKTFQEYLAAVEITTSKQENLLIETFNDEKKLAWWRETILFYAAQTDATNLIKQALNHKTVSVLTLAYQCAKEAEIAPETRKQLTNTLELGLESDHLDKFTLAAEVKITDRLSQLNNDLLTSEIDSEQENIAKDTSCITWAEYQLFLNESINNNISSNSSPTTLENKKRANQPVTGISFWDANNFCAWLSLRSRKELGEPGICYRQPKQKEQENNDDQIFDDKIKLLRFLVPARYAELAYYLAAGMWKEADQETLKVMLEVMGREKQGYLELEDIRQFPCQDLRIIDQLWVNYSNGLFGFSVQKEIYLSVGGILEAEGSLTNSPLKVFSPLKQIYSRLGGRVKSKDEMYLHAFLKFADRVKWRENERRGWRKIAERRVLIYEDRVVENEREKGSRMIRFDWISDDELFRNIRGNREGQLPCRVFRQRILARDVVRLGRVLHRVQTCKV